MVVAMSPALAYTSVTSRQLGRRLPWPMSPSSRPPLVGGALPLPASSHAADVSSSCSISDGGGGAELGFEHHVRTASDPSPDPDATSTAPGGMHAVAGQCASRHRGVTSGGTSLVVVPSRHGANERPGGGSLNELDRMCVVLAR